MPTSRRFGNGDVGLTSMKMLVDHADAVLSSRWVNSMVIGRPLRMISPSSGWYKLKSLHQRILPRRFHRVTREFRLLTSNQRDRWQGRRAFDDAAHRHDSIVPDLVANCFFAHVSCLLTDVQPDCVCMCFAEMRPFPDHISAIRLPAAASTALRASSTIKFAGLPTLMPP